jgi:hypothetical protein
VGAFIAWLDSLVGGAALGLGVPPPPWAYFNNGWATPLSAVTRMLLDYTFVTAESCGPKYGPSWGPAQFAATYGCVTTNVVRNSQVQVFYLPEWGYQYPYAWGPVQWVRPHFKQPGEATAPESTVTWTWLWDSYPGMLDALHEQLLGDPIIPDYFVTEPYDLFNWNKEFPFDSNDPDKCSAHCAFVPSFCAAPAAPAQLPAPTLPAPAACTADAVSGAPVQELDMRMLPSSAAGNAYGQDVVVATLPSCALLSARGSDLACRVQEAILVEGVSYAVVGTAEELHMLPAPACGVA